MSELRAWVDKLGAMQPDEIRTLMQDENIGGLIGAPRSCPLAHFLTAKTGHQVLVTSDIYAIATDDDDDCGGTLIGDPITPPDSIAVFVTSFDNREYPELIGQ